MFFTFTHLADAFNQNDVQAIHSLWVHVSIFSSESLQMSFCMLSGDQTEEKASTSRWCKQCTGHEATRLLDGWGCQPKCNHSTTPTQQERQMLHMTPTSNTTNVHEPRRPAARRNTTTWQITTNYISQNVPRGNSYSQVTLSLLGRLESRLLFHASVMYQMLLLKYFFDK